VALACMGASIVGITLMCTACCVLHQMRHPPGSGKETASPRAATIPPEDLKLRFENAQKDAMAKLTASTPETTRMDMYGLYNQAAKGDVQGPRPGMFKRTEQKKWDAWKRREGMSREVAMTQYCSAVDLL